MCPNLDGRRFRPVSNSETGRVSRDAVFTFSQSGDAFQAYYQGTGFTDGHLIGTLTGDETATLVYHCRALDGALEVGQAEACFISVSAGRFEIAMSWCWLNGSRTSGTSHYCEIDDD